MKFRERCQRIRTPIAVLQSVEIVGRRGNPVQVQGLHPLRAHVDHAIDVLQLAFYHQKSLGGNHGSVLFI